MLDQNLKDQIQYAYKRMKHGRIKGFLLCWVIYVFMGGIVSLFLGNPFPHKEVFSFFNIGFWLDLYMGRYTSLSVSDFYCCRNGFVVYRIVRYDPEGFGKD